MSVVGERLAACAAAVAVLLVLAGPPAAAQGGGLVVDRFDARLRVDADGSVQVAEDIAVDFGTVERRGIIRAIPVRFDIAEGDTQVRLPEGRDAGDFRRVLDVELVEVAATAPDDVDVSRDGDLLAIRIGDPDITVTGKHAYRLRYLVGGALNAFADRAELTWDVTGTQWDGPIVQTTAVVDAPGIVDAACYQGPPGSTAACDRVDIGDDRVEFASGALPPGHTMTISVGFPLNAVAVPPPLVQERWRLSRALAASPATVPLTAGTSAVGLVVAGWAWRRSRPTGDPGGPGAGGGLRGDPPEGLRPAQLGVLLDERTDHRTVSATIFDLAARGHLRIEQTGDDGSRPRYRLERTGGGDPDALLDYERDLLDGLFAGGDSVSSDQLRDLADEQQRLREAVEADAVARGWFPDIPVRLRGGRTMVSLLLVLGAVALLGLGLALTTFALAAVPLVAAAVTVVVARERTSIHTLEGARLADQARAFRAYLTATEAAQVDGEAGELFGRHLPYALALDVAPQWVARFGDAAVPMEQWAPAYYVVPVGYDPHGYAARLDGFTAQVRAQPAKAPSSSSSSGWGSSGSGFGGGGGRAW